MISRRENSRQLFMVSAAFLAPYLRYVPALSGDSVCLSAIEYLKASLNKDDKKAFDRLVLIDLQVRNPRFSGKLTYDNLMKYLDCIALQNDFILQNHQALCERGEIFRNLQTYMEFSAVVSRAVLDQLRGYYQTLMRENEAGDELLIDHIFLMINETAARLISIFEKYKEQKNFVMGPEWWFQFFQSKLEGVLLYTHLSPQLTTEDLTKIGAIDIFENIYQVFLIMKTVEGSQIAEYDIVLQVLKSKIACDIHRSLPAAIACIREADLMRRRYFAKQAITELNSDSLKYNIKSLQLGYLVSNCRGNLEEKREDIQTALKFAFELNSDLQQGKVPDEVREGIQGVLLRLFSYSLIAVQYRLHQLSLTEIKNFSVLKDDLAQLNQLIKIYKTTITLKTQAVMSADFEKLTQSSALLGQVIEAEEKLVQKKINDQAKSDAVFDDLMKSPSKKKRHERKKQKPASKPVIQDSVSDDELPPLIPFEEAQFVLPVAERCRRFFESHKLRQYHLFVDQVDDADKPEVMLYIGNHYGWRGRYDEAFSWYEKAIDQAESIKQMNPALKKDIESALSESKNQIQLKLQENENALQLVKENRKQFIYQLGLSACFETMQNPKTMSEEEINTLGQQAFEALGKRNRDKQGKSAPVQEREKLNKTIDRLKASLSISERLEKRLTGFVRVLANNPAGLYYNEKDYPLPTSVQSSQGKKNKR